MHSAELDSDTELTVLSTFTGLGGLDLGLESAGFGCVGVVERDPDALRSLKANRDGDWTRLEPNDIEALAKQLRPSDLGLMKDELTLLSGAPPCQPFSKASQWNENGRRGMADPRARYLSSFLTLFENFQPKAAILENVSGFVQGKHSVLPILSEWLGCLNDRSNTQYKMEWRVLDAADYGVPQHRRRAIVMIHSANQSFPWPSPAFHDQPMTAWDALHSLEQTADLPASSGKWADLLPSIPEGSNYQWLTRKGGGPALFGYRTRYWSFLLKLARDRPSWTLPASPGPSAGPFHWDNRPLSVPELLRLQTFPDDWIVEGNGRREHVRQIGNATPPLLGEALGLSIRQCLGIDSWSPSRFLPTRAESTPEPLAPAGLPKGYRDRLGNHADHPGTGKGPAHTPSG